MHTTPTKRHTDHTCRRDIPGGTTNPAAEASGPDGATRFAAGPRVVPRVPSRTPPSGGEDPFVGGVR